MLGFEDTRSVMSALRSQQALRACVVWSGCTEHLQYTVSRSVTMDAWSGDQLKKMQLGGNDALNAFLGKYSVDKFTEIKEKYNSQAAEVRPCDVISIQLLEDCPLSSEV